MNTSACGHRTTAILGLFAAASLPLWVARAENLNNLIPGLYGGNGITLATGTPHSAHFAEESGSALQQLNQRLATSFGRYPVSSSSGNFAFAFDTDLGTAVNTTETLGPIFAERAPTIGRGKWSLNFYATFFDYDTLNGRSIHDLHATALHDADVAGGFDPDQPSGLPIPGVRTGFELDRIDIKVDVNASVRIYSPALTYGVTDKLDISAVLPIVDVDMDVRSRYSLVLSPLNPRPDVHDTNVVHGAEPPTDHKHGSSTGIGDFVLGAKYEFYQGGVVDLAGAFLAQFPTGDERNFLGTGDTLLRPFLVASHSFTGIAGSPISITPHLNLGYQYDIDYADRSALDYVLGFDVGTRRVTLAGEFLGRHTQRGDDLLDVAVGVKWNVYKRLVASGNVILPVNDTGLRSDVITTLGLGVTF
jgi:hypothetical protein